VGVKQILQRNLTVEKLKMSILTKLKNHTFSNPPILICSSGVPFIGAKVLQNALFCDFLISSNAIAPKKICAVGKIAKFKKFKTQIVRLLWTDTSMCIKLNTYCVTIF